MSRRPAGAVTALLCDADGNLFPSEEPAFAASADVVNRFTAQLGGSARATGEELRLAATGRNFRSIAVELAALLGVTVPAEELARWVLEEQRVVTAHLGSVLRPDPSVRDALDAIAPGARLALVSSSALERLDACLAATGLAEHFPPELRFSAEDSLPQPRSKPDPAIYRLAVDELGIDASTALALEDSVPGVRSAVAAGVPVLGNVAFVPHAERAARTAELRGAGAYDVVDAWEQVPAACGLAAVGC